MTALESLKAFGLFLVLALVLHFPHYGSHYGDPNFDFYLHYQWAKEYAESVAHGWFYPRWTFFARFGLGEPMFVFYSPLYYLLSALLALGGMTVWNAMHVVEVLSNAVFGWFVYLTCRHYVSNRLALVAGFAAAANPFLVMLHYKFQGFAWASVGYVAHGMLLWALFRPKADPERINLLAAVALCLAVLSHTMSTLVMLICYSAAALVAPATGGAVRFAGLFRRLVAWGCTVALGLGMSAIYLLPAVGSQSLINTDAWTGPHILQAFAWPTFSALINGIQWFSFQWPLAVPVLMLLLALGWFLFKLKGADGQQSRPLLMRLFLVLATAAFFASELSYPLWAIQSPLLRIQLPYRFLSVAYVMVIVISVLAAQAAQARGRRGWEVGLVRSVVAVGVLGLFIAAKATYFDGGKLLPALERDQYSFELLPQWSRTPDGGFTCRAEKEVCMSLPLSAGSFRGTPEYATKLVAPGFTDWAVGGFAKECETHHVACGPARYVTNTVAWHIEARDATTLRLPVFLFPMWAVEVDGTSVPAVHDPATGLIQVALAPGVHEVRLEWTETQLFTTARWITIICSGVLIVLGVAGSARRRAHAGGSHPGKVCP